MKKPKDYWTVDKLQAVAKNCKTRYELYKKNLTVYNKLRKLKLLESIFGPAKKNI